jgi:hypothetical protein
VGSSDQPNRHLLPGQERIRLDTHRERMEACTSLAQDQQSCNLRQVESKGGQVCCWKWCQVSSLLCSDGGTQLINSGLSLFVLLTRRTTGGYPSTSRSLLGRLYCPSTGTPTISCSLQELRTLKHMSSRHSSRVLIKSESAVMILWLEADEQTRA